MSERPQWPAFREAEGQARPQEPRIVVLDSLRGMAAIAIVLFHYEAMFYGPSTDPSVENLRFRYAMLGAELFFVISGYVILSTISRSSSTLHFLLGRVARIYPAYWLSVVLAAMVLLWDRQDVVRVAVVNLTMMQSFVYVRSLIPPYWTLAYELWFYVTIALVFHFRLISRLPALCAVWLLMAFIARTAGLHSYGPPGILTMLPFGQFFIAGMMIYLEHRGDGTPLTKSVLVMCLLSCAFGRNDWSHVSGPIYFVSAAAFFAAVYCATGRGLAMLRMRWLVWIGRLSYSLYLLHFTVALFCVHAVQQIGWPAWAGVAAAVPLSIITAARSRRWVEIPGQNAINALVFAAIQKRSASRRLPKSNGAPSR